MILGIVLSAGRGRRIGSPKALLVLGGETFHARAVRAFHDAGVDVLVVVSDDVDRALPQARSRENRIVNPDPDQPDGMYSSVRIAVTEALRQQASGAVLLPVDHPLVAADDIRLVATTLRESGGIVVPTHDGRRGHPIGIGHEVMVEIANDMTLQTLRDVVRRDRGRVREVSASEGVLRGINTQEDLARASDARFR